MTKHGLTVSVAILNYNGFAHLETYLPSVVKNTPNAFKVIVIDNGSTDDSLQLLKGKFPSVQVIQLPENYGFVGGYNKGMQSIDTDITVLLNSDVEVTQGWIESVLPHFEDTNVAACQPKILAWKDKTKFEHAGAAGGLMDFLGYPYSRGRVMDHTEVDSGQHDSIAHISWASGAAMFVRTHLFKEIGGFDENYFAHFEEIDLCWRLRNCGYDILAVPSSTVYHLGGGTLDYSNPRKIFYNFRNSLLTILKNESPTKLLWLIPLRLILDGIAGVKFALEGNFKAVLSIIKAHFSFYALFFKTIKKRGHNIKPIRSKRTEGISYKSIIWSYYIKNNKLSENL